MNKRGARSIVAGLIVCGVGMAFLTGRWSAPRRHHAGAVASTPGSSSPEAAFAREMAVHHAQAVDMAERIRRRTSDEELRLLATDIVLGQEAQIGRFQGWLEAWHLNPNAKTQMGASSKAAKTTMAEMDGMELTGHSMPTDSTSEPMPGMASRADVSSLSTLALDQAQQRFLALMIAHHRGGVAMAQSILKQTARPEVTRLATAIVQSQTSEISAMEAMRKRLKDPVAAA